MDRSKRRSRTYLWSKRKYDISYAGWQSDIVYASRANVLWEPWPCEDER